MHRPEQQEGAGASKIRGRSPHARGAWESDQQSRGVANCLGAGLGGWGRLAEDRGAGIARAFSASSDNSSSPSSIARPAEEVDGHWARITTLGEGQVEKLRRRKFGQWEMGVDPVTPRVRM